MISSILQWIDDPYVFFLFLLTCAGVFHLARRLTGTKVCFSLAIFWLFVVSISPLPQWLVFNLERQYPVLSIANIDTSRTTYIIILGSGQSHDSTLQITNRLGAAGLARLTEALRIASQVPSAVVVCSGNSAAGRLPQAYTIGLAVFEFGCTRRDTMLLPSPGTTSEEAVAFSKRFPGDGQVILVTSAYHMARAVAYFRRHGLNPIPAPTEHLMKVDPLHHTYDFMPSLKKMEMMDKVLHEYAGWLKFKLEELEV